MKEALFSAIQFEIQNAKFLDLFAGSGQMGIEALSRGAASATFIDNDRKAHELIKENVRTTGFESKSVVVQSDYLSFLNRCTEKFHIIFLDPPYAGEFLENSLKKITEIDILEDCGIIICERPADKLQEIEIPGLIRAKDYRYGKTWITIYRKVNEG